MRQFLDFEKPIAELENKIDELRRMSLPASGGAGTQEGGLPIAEEVSRLEEKAERQLKAIYAKLTPWQKDAGRAPSRTGRMRWTYIAALITDYHAAGRRPGLRRRRRRWWAGCGRFDGRAVLVLGTERGSDTRHPAARTISAWPGPRAIARRGA